MIQNQNKNKKNLKIPWDKIIWKHVKTYGMQPKVVHRGKFMVINGHTSRKKKKF